MMDKPDKMLQQHRCKGRNNPDNNARQHHIGMIP